MTVLPTVRAQIVEAARREATVRHPVFWPFRRTGLRRGRLAGRVQHPHGLQRRRIAVWPLVLALSVGVTVAIAVGALVLVHRSGQGQSSASQTRGLIARLAVLRRPQQPSDKLPVCCHPQSSLDGAIIPRFSRLLATAPAARFYLVVTKPAVGPRPLWNSRLGNQVAIVEIARGNVTETPGIPAADLNDPSQVQLLGYARRGQSSRQHPYAVEIVPDGVAHVRWNFRDPRGGPGHVVSLRAMNNLVVTPASRLTAPLLLQHVTWYRANGTLAPTSFAALREARAAQDAPRRARELKYDLEHSYPAPPGLLARFSIFKIDSPTGVRVAPGVVILHPKLSSAPFSIIDAASAWSYEKLDPLQMREVITPSVTLFVVPGQRGICIGEIDKSPLTGIPDGGGSSCNDQGVTQAGSHGVGLGGYGDGYTTTFGIVPDTQKTVTIQVGHTTRIIRPIYGIYIFRLMSPPGRIPTVRSP